ncbi:TetR/AcrR family transcriptional regulator [Paenibacillus glucanolyticus]|jgi:AcrR family transcriptional regulator|uniref:TetR/AcrR family transcriptional regulator n=1 Tax=Paenibacillus TaxID=44249 RepID=UPI0003E1CD9B|nr:MULTISPECIES: TetR/AcrR family transcriptional regulator [Paenibacillus]ANA78605.1 TetR family transcriptional regulator [Paenibacillus glucanolyticus]AVV57480.1 TetR/AcrR family transcriptional regulator [Paenibacillus glucanolyticus]ETT34914.1 TetR family transcriptional regulator [Paenibacillus sp. FSL R5-808]MPY16969.1 TetR/AcrR family transcriptional regulator [Paenibacillus glucanolyticus]OMF80886.1 TetR family transcriptional regulator [Paenibacillus glucanolyticus]
MRVVKKAEDRKNEILDAVDELFGQKGFDGTSTNDILEKVGIARGTLYHHFKSKEDIMDALIDRYAVRLIDGAQEVAADKSIPIVERIIRVVMALNLSGGSSEQIMEHIHKPQNALMHQKIQKVIINGVPPILTEIIREGIQQGLFSTPFPYECMEMVVIYASTVFDDDLVVMTEKERSSRIVAFVCNVERLLGAESGSLMDVMGMFGEGDESSRD